MNFLFYKKPKTSGIRHQVFLKKNLFSFFKLKKFFNIIFYSIGKNNKGKIIFRHRKKKNVKKYYNIYSNYLNNYKNIPFKIKLIIFDDIKNSLIMLLKSFNGLIILRKYIDGLYQNDIVYNWKTFPLHYSPGSICKLDYLYEGSIISNIQLIPYGEIKLLRSSGTSTILLLKEQKYVKIRLQTGIFIYISKYCIGYIGKNLNLLNYQRFLGKAGKSINMGIRPSVRGVAMNPIDHPHGGGEGKKSKKKTIYSPWGKVYKFKKTSK